MTIVTDVMTPQRWAFRLTHILNACMGSDRFPISVDVLAKDISHQLYPDDPITLVKGADLYGFEGCLAKAPKDKKGWGIIYNKQMQSQGRIKFTLAHELGHYLLHRTEYPEGVRCGEQDFLRWDSEYGQIEHQANIFAANLLMPLDDFRSQIEAQAKADLSTISHCADRYGVSLIAATLRWIEYTERRAILVVSRSGFILWARSSKSALKTGAFFKTANRAPIPVPQHSFAANPIVVRQQHSAISMPKNTWLLNESCEETSIFSEQYDFNISLLQLNDGSSNWGSDFEG